MSGITTQIEKPRLLQEGPRPEQVQNHLERLLNPLILRNKFHLGKVMEEAPTTRANQLMRSVQNATMHRIAALNQPQEVQPQPAPVVWKDENIRLQVFYGFLNQKDRAAFELCEAIRSHADLQIHGIVKTQGAPAQEIQQAQDLAISRAREAIGKVVFIADRSEAPLKIDPKDVGTSMQYIEQAVNEELSYLNKNLHIQNEFANSFELQDRDMLMYTVKPKEIANVLLTSQGQLNLGMIRAVIEEFIPSDHPPLEYEQGILNVLSKMDSSWQEWIDAIQPPAKDRIASNALIRADLSLPLGHPITQLHCQRVALGGLLSQLCQGEVGDCFAVQWAIKKHNEFFLNSFKDYSALIQNGYLTRDVDGVPDQFFFKTTIADDSLSRKFTLHSNGHLEEFPNAFVWECPNFAAACLQMGILEPEREVMKLLVNVDSQRITWDDLIEKLAHVAENSEHTAEELHMLGRYGFSLSDNRLLRAWETTLAAMSEAESDDYVRGNVNGCAMTVLKPVFGNSEKHATSYQKTVIEELKAAVTKAFNNSFRLVYNSSIPLHHIASDGSSTSGGFELYQRDVRDLSSMGIRIATPEQFRGLVFTALNQAIDTETSKVSSKKDRIVLASVASALNLCVHGKNFPRDTLWAYDDANRKVADPVADYKDLENTPMQALVGDDPWKVIAIDTGRDFTPDIRTIRPNNPGDLLKWLLGLAKWKESTEHYLRNDGIEEDSATGPDHAFNIEFESGEFKSFLADSLTPSAWIRETLIKPGFKVSQAEIGNDSKKAMQTSVTKWINNIFKDVPDPVVHEIETLFTDLNRRVINVHQYAQRVRDGLIKIFDVKGDDVVGFSLALDRMLMHSLPKDQLQTIQSGAVRFAKTNWNAEGGKNIYFCCFFNPRTEKVDFGTIIEDHTDLQPMDQREWVDRQQWAVDPVGIKALGSSIDGTAAM